ncbi:MAG: hypothetical protein FJ299_02350 [Planctomycetes bacterium]|nr:hypothetical protein [Planctomycetota bacterium]
MWLQFYLWCAASLLSCGCAIAAALHTRKLGRRIAQLGQSLTQKQREAAALTARVVEREAQLAQQIERKRSLQSELAARDAKIETAQLRIEQERSERQQQNARLAAGEAGDSAGARVAREAELARLSGTIDRLTQEVLAKSQQLESLGLRCGELEGRLKGRDAELSNSTAELEALRAAVRAGEQQAAAQPESNEELEQVLQRLSRQEGVLEHTLQARIADLVEQLASSGAANEELRGLVKAQEARSTAMAARAADLEQQLEQGRHAEQERLLHDQEVQRSLCVRATELEERIASDDQVLSRLSAEIDRLRVELEAERRRGAAASEQGASLEQELQRRELREQERVQHEEQVHHALCVRAEQTEQQLAAREGELREQAARIEQLQQQLAAQVAQVEASGRREAQLHQEAERRSAQEQERVRLAEEMQRSLCARIGELEERMAGREAELSERAAEVQVLQQDVFAKCQQIEVDAKRAADLELELQQHARKEQELRQLLDVRAVEFEAQLAARDEQLRDRVTALADLQQHVTAKCEQLESEAKAAAELQQELQRRARQEEALRLMFEGRNAEFEARLAAREDDLARLRAEAQRLEEESRAAAAQADQHAGELRIRDQQAAESRARLEALDFAIQAAHEEAEASLAVSDELLQPRLAALHACGSSARPLPRPYVKAVERGDLHAALQGLFSLGEPLSDAAVRRLCEGWGSQYEAWKQAPFQREVVYLWAETVRLAAGHSNDSDALFTLVASFADGTRSLVAVESGVFGSKRSWSELLRAQALRGMNEPRLVIASALSGCADALAELGWSSARQSCWNEKTAELVAALPRARRSEAAQLLRAMANAEKRAEAKLLFDRFVKRCGVRCAAVGEALRAAWKPLMSFHAFPSEHWSHLRTVGLVEARLAALRLRADKPVPGPSVPHVDAVLWKLLSADESGFRRLPAAAPVAKTVSARAESAESREKRPAKSRARARSR